MLKFGATFNSELIEIEALLLHLWFLNVYKSKDMALTNARVFLCFVVFSDKLAVIIELGEERSVPTTGNTILFASLFLCSPDGPAFNMSLPGSNTHYGNLLINLSGSKHPKDTTTPTSKCPSTLLGGQLWTGRWLCCANFCTGTSGDRVTTSSVFTIPSLAFLQTENKQWLSCLNLLHSEISLDKNCFNLLESLFNSGWIPSC